MLHFVDKRSGYLACVAGAWKWGRKKELAREGDTRVSLPFARPFFLGPAMQATGYQIKKQ